jgi:MFS family permease
MSLTTTTHPFISDAKRRYTLFILVLVFTSSHVDRQIMGILGQPIKESLLLTDTQLGLLTGIMFAFFYATLGMPMAMWADRGNRRNIITLSITLWSGMTALCGLTQTYLQLLLARIGVGVGEAGSNPPSHSMIADLYPPEQRATAMAIFAMGINAGIMLGFLIGGWVNEWLDWRWAFIIAGLPGLLIALLVRFTITEPPRGYSEPNVAVAQPPKFAVVLRTLFASAVLRNVVSGGMLAAFAGYAAVIWVPVYFVRIHGLGTGETGTYLALIIGIGGALGSFSAGWLADRWGSRNHGWRAWVVALATLITIPFLALAFIQESATNTMWLYAIPAILGTAYVGPGFALIQSNVPLEMRSVAAAINLFITNIVGLGLGPLSVGILSDWFEPTYGTDGLRYALFLVPAISVWSMLHYLRAGQHLRRLQSVQSA